jgi:hypothetical protein
MNILWGSQKHLLLTLLTKNPLGLTVDDLTDSFNREQFWKRISELKKAGYVEHTNIKRKNQRVFIISSKGIEYFPLISQYVSCKICNKSFIPIANNGVFCSKECKRVTSIQQCKRYYNNNKEVLNAQNKEWRENNKEKYLTKNKEWRENNKEWVKQYRQTKKYKEQEKIRNKKYKDKNKDKLIKLCKEWREKKKKSDPNYDKERYYKHREKQLAHKRKKYEEKKDILLAKSKEWRENNQAWIKDYRKKRRTINKDRQIQRYKEEPSYRLKVLLRRRIADCIKRNKMSKDLHTMELLGTDIETARIHLENQFKENMSWDNHGNYGWHIDHIIPCSSFDLTDIEQQKKCFHYTNLQPLWWWDNLSKGSKIL